MTVLIDTNALIFSLKGVSSLTPAAANVMNGAAVTRIFSAAVFWEMTIKQALGKLILPEAPFEIWNEIVARQAGHILQIAPRHLSCLGSLPPHHNDPFDRIMIAQALSENLPVLSSDAQWDAYGVQRIW